MTVLADEAERILANAPCSVELPAGCGKTETIARLALSASLKGERALILTHTHAGVDAIRKRLRTNGVPTASARVGTLDSWCFALIYKYPMLAGLEVGDEPDWEESKAYHEGGALAVRSSAIQRMLKASYNLVIVDEYQDCQKWQHELVRAISDAVPTVVFGDRMQGLFFFGSANAPVVWESDVLPAFPAVEVEVTPWRWSKHHPELGEWLLETRQKLMLGREIDFSSAPVDVYGTEEKQRACNGQPKHPLRVVAIASQPNVCAHLAPRLFGYSMIEEIEGKFLLGFADTVDGAVPAEIAAETVEFAANCANGVAAVFKKDSRRKLAKGGRLTAPRFAEFQPQVRAIERLLDKPSVSNVSTALRELAKLPDFRIHRREAWFGILDALTMARIEEELTVRGAVINHRERIRMTGRYPQSRVLARPLLIKGLEFDYAVVTDAEVYNAHELYVCLTRGSRGLSVVTDKTSLSPGRPC